MNTSLLFFSKNGFNKNVPFLNLAEKDRSFKAKSCFFGKSFSSFLFSGCSSKGDTVLLANSLFKSLLSHAVRLDCWKVYQEHAVLTKVEVDHVVYSGIVCHGSGAGMASAYVELWMRETEFYDCFASIGEGGGLFLLACVVKMNCTLFDLCGMTYQGDQVWGNAFKIDSSVSDLRDIEGYRCYNTTNSGDSVFELFKGEFIVKSVNISDSCCTNSGGAYEFRNSKISCHTFINIEDCNLGYIIIGKDNQEGTIKKSNFLNNVLKNYHYYLTTANSLILDQCCIFGNGKMSYYGTLIFTNCLGDDSGIKGVTKTSSTTQGISYENLCFFMGSKRFSVEKIRKSIRIWFFFVIL